MAATSKPQRNLIKKGVIENREQKPKNYGVKNEKKGFSNTTKALNPKAAQKKDTKIREKIFKRTNLKHGIKSDLRDLPKEDMNRLASKASKKGNLRDFIKVRAK